MYPLLEDGGFDDIQVSPRMVYADKTLPLVQAQFVLRTIVPMVEGVRTQALARRLMTPADWEEGIEDLKRTALSARGTFCYTFFKAVGRKGER